MATEPDCPFIPDLKDPYLLEDPLDEKSVLRRDEANKPVKERHLEIKIEELEEKCQLYEQRLQEMAEENKNLKT